MANPQKENGYIAIANEIIDALMKTPIGKSNMQVLLAVIRKTYGWQKKEDDISISQLQAATGCSRRTVIYAIQNLEAKKIIFVKRAKNQNKLNNINKIKFNKNYTQWVVQEKARQYSNVLKSRKKRYKELKKRVVQEKNGSARNCKKVVQETEKDGRFLAPTKETITKENITKENTRKEKIDSEILYKYYLEKINPFQKSKHRALKNINRHLKKHSSKELAKAVLNYWQIAKTRYPEHRKDPANFFGVNDPFFLDYLPDNFRPQRKGVEPELKPFRLQTYEDMVKAENDIGYIPGVMENVATG